MLTFSGGQTDGTQTACITSIEHRIGGRQSIRCVGKNPRLAQAKSKNDKNISGLLNQIEAGKIGIHTFTNASAYTIADSDVRIISIEFASSEETHVQFFGQVLVDVAAVQTDWEASAKGSIVIPSNTDGTAETDGSDESSDSVTVEVELPVTWTEDGMAEVIVTFVFNDDEILLHHPVETWHSGKHILSLYYPIDNVVPNITNTFEVYLRMANGTGAWIPGAALLDERSGNGGCCGMGRQDQYRRNNGRVYDRRRSSGEGICRNHKDGNNGASAERLQRPCGREICHRRILPPGGHGTGGLK